MFEFIKSFMEDGGVFMYVILVVWTIGLALSIYKYIELQKSDINGEKFMGVVKKHVIENKVEDAINLCSGSSGVLPQVVKSGLKRANLQREQIQDAIDNKVLEVIPTLTYRLNYVSLIANVSTLIGLLGTIQGLISSFAAVSSADPSMKAKLLADGISKAMNTTAFGLVSAITVMVLHTILMSKAQKIEDKIEEFSSKVIDLLSTKKI